MMTLPPNSYPAEIEVWLSVNRSQSLDHHAGLFPGWHDQGGPECRCAFPLLRSLGRALAGDHTLSHPRRFVAIKSANPTGLVCLGQALNSLELTSPG